MARINNFQRDISMLIDRTLSREAQQKMIATAARGILKDAQEQNARVLGQTPPHEHWVDSQPQAPFESINPDGGNITVKFQLVNEVVDWIYRKIVEESPQLTGEYRKSHRLFADGAELDAPDLHLQAQKWEIVSNVPYARKIERGQSDQAPDGVYEVTAALARQRFGNVADIKYTWVGIIEGMTGEYATHARSQRQAGQSRRAWRDSNRPIREANRPIRLMNKAIRYPAIKIWTR